MAYIKKKKKKKKKRSALQRGGKKKEKKVWKVINKEREKNVIEREF